MKRIVTAVSLALALLASPAAHAQLAKANVSHNRINVHIGRVNVNARVPIRANVGVRANVKAQVPVRANVKAPIHAGVQAPVRANVNRGGAQAKYRGAAQQRSQRGARAPMTNRRMGGQGYRPARQPARRA